MCGRLSKSLGIKRGKLFMDILDIYLQTILNSLINYSFKRKYSQRSSFCYIKY